MSLKVAVVALAALAGVAAPNASRAADCSTASKCDCQPATAPSQQEIDLGDYRGAVGVYKTTAGRRAITLVCPREGACRCALPDDFTLRDVKVQDHAYEITFDGATYPFVPGAGVYLGATPDGRLLFDHASFLGDRVSAEGRRLVLSERALRPVRIRLNGAKYLWGVELWENQGFVHEGEKRVRVIVGTRNLLTVDHSDTGAPAGGAIFGADERGRVSLGPVSAGLPVVADGFDTIDFLPTTK